MRKRHVAVGLLVLVAGAVSYELAHLAEARPAVYAIDPARAGLGIHAAAGSVPLRTATTPAGGSTFDSVADAALFASTGIALFVLAAGVRRGAR